MKKFGETNNNRTDWQFPSHRVENKQHSQEIIKKKKGSFWPHVVRCDAEIDSQARQATVEIRRQIVVNVFQSPAGHTAAGRCSHSTTWKLSGGQLAAVYKLTIN